jgi:Sec-independent protein translocase protein TatA
MFDLSMGEVFITFGVAVAVIGRKDLPKVARAAGRVLGKSVGYLQKTKQDIGSATSAAELRKIQTEINQSIKDLEEIKRDVYSAGNFRQAFQRAEPGPENKFATDPIKSREPLPASSLIPAVPSTPQCLSVSQTTSVVSGSMSGSSILVEALRDGRSLVSKANKKSH